MSDQFEEQGWVRMGVASALSNEYLKDQANFLLLLSEVLTKADPSAVKPITKGLFKKELVGLEATFGGERFVIQKLSNGSLDVVRTRIVRGIALKSEQADMAECLEDISNYIEESAKKNRQNRDAMAKLLGLD